VDGSVEKELEAINKRIETMLDIVLEHFGDTADRFEILEEQLNSPVSETKGLPKPIVKERWADQFGDWGEKDAT
jgi:hypothetical protein